MRLDQMRMQDAVTLMLTEENQVPRRLLRWRREIARAAEWVSRAFKQGGRLFYVGAGTSGRLGVLDASECPPTFRADPRMVQGIMAGGERALRHAVEGAEDDLKAGAKEMRRRRVARRDVVVGIAASGTTKFVWSALREARRRGAKTILLCFNPYLEIPAPVRPDLVIAPNLGPEVLTGSTRLKAGTATKLVLNMLTTLAMVRLGKVAGNLMVDVAATNEKLRDRATRIAQALSGTAYAEARAVLSASGWRIKKAVAHLARKSPGPPGGSGRRGTPR